MPAGAKPGERRGGRQKGTPNKISSEIKQALYEALNNGDGATAYFLELRTEHPKTFENLISKLLPRQVTGADDDPLIQEYDLDHLAGRVEACRRISFAFAKVENDLGVQCTDVPEQPSVSD